MFFDLETRSLYAPVIEGFNAFSNEFYIYVTSENRIFSLNKKLLSKTYHPIILLCLG